MPKIKKEEFPETTDLEKFENRSDDSTDVMLPAITPNQIMMEAVRNKQPKEVLEILQKGFEFELKVKAQQAREAYHRAMAAFKSNPPEIEKDKTVSYQAAASWIF